MLASTEQTPPRGKTYQKHFDSPFNPIALIFSYSYIAIFATFLIYVHLNFNGRFHGDAGDGHLHTHHIRIPEVLPFHMTPLNLLCRVVERIQNFGCLAGRLVGAYCVAKGSTAFYASLDAEGAFDLLPHCVILEKCADVLPNNLWLLLHNCYSSMHIQIKWNSCLSDYIPVQHGTKQGGLCSPFIFNLLYHDLVSKLQTSNYGVKIRKYNFNCFCYADDIYSCVFGKPFWTIDNVPLNVSANIKYLGTEFGNLSGKVQCDSRIKTSMKAYYSLQISGIKHPEVDSHAVMDIYSSAIQCISQYGCVSVYINKSCVSNLNKLQGKLIKRFLNLSLSCHTQPLLKCFNMGRTDNNIVIGTLDLL